MAPPYLFSVLRNRMKSRLPEDRSPAAGARIPRLLGSRPVMSAVSIGSKIAVRAGTFVVIAPIIGPANQGAIVVSSTWAATALLIMAFGFQVRALRELAIDIEHAHSVVVGDLRTMVALILPSAVLGVGVAALALSPEDRWLFAILFVATMGSVVGDYCASSLRSLDQYRTEATLSLAMSVLQMGFMVGSALVFPSLIVLATAMLVSRAIFAAVSLRVLFSVPAMRASRNFEARTVRRSFLEAFPFFIDASLSVLLSGIDILLLNHFVSKGEIGSYAVGSRIVQLFLVLPWIATNVLVPQLARAARGAAFRREFAKLLTSMMTIGFLGAAGLTIGGPYIVSLILGARFADLNAMWPAFAALVIIRFAESSFGIGMTALGRMRARVWVQIGATLSITLLGVPLLSHVGINAFVLSIAATYFMVGSYYAFNLREELLSR